MSPSDGSHISSADVPAEISATQSFHPEFGYLCPSAWLRRRVRRAVMMVVTGMSVAGSAALAVSAALGPNAADVVMREQTSAIAAAAQPIDRTADQAGRVSLPEPAADRTAERYVAPRPQGSCDDLSVSFLMSQCQLGKSGKSHMTREARSAHAESRRVAVMSIGRLDEASATEPHMAEAAAADAIAGEGAPVPLPPERPAAPPTKPIKIAHKPAPSPDKASKETSVAAPPTELSFFGLFHLSSRSGSGAWAMSW